MSNLPLLFVVCKRFSRISLSRGIRTDAFLLLSRRRRNEPYYVGNEPGIRHRAQDFEDLDEIDEEMVDGEMDVMNIDRAYDMDKREITRQKYKVQKMITAKKFFKPRPDPATLTCNERQYIRFLHKKDPVQWDIHTLSESFPASPYAIKKIIKQKWKITPEKAKVLDAKVQANWTLFEEGKLDANPKLLEHLKKFVNRREVLLEQLKNSDSYLPEVKKEPEWNCGEFKSILDRYEKKVERLARESEKKKMLKDGVSEHGDQGKAEESSDVLHKRIDKEVARKKLENKDSFMFGNVTKFYAKHTTLEEMEEELLKRALSRKKLKLVEQSILDNILNAKSHNEGEVSYLKKQFSQSHTPQEGEKSKGQSVEAEVKTLADIQLDRIEMEIINRKRKSNEEGIRQEETKPFPVSESPDNGPRFRNKTGTDKTLNNMVQEGAEMSTKQFDFQNKFSTSEEKMREEETSEPLQVTESLDNSPRFRNKVRSDKTLNNMVQVDAEMRPKQFAFRNKFSEERIREEQLFGRHEPFQYPPDERTKFTTETRIAEVLEHLQNPPKHENAPKAEEEITEKVPKIFSPESLQRADEYYDKEVRDIENTAFWNKKRSSEEKAVAEADKANLYEESRVATPGESKNSGFYLSETPYPERINIPEGRRIPGATYRVKDCYYDDDGEFLYRVPGMTK